MINLESEKEVVGIGERFCGVEAGLVSTMDGCGDDE